MGNALADDSGQRAGPARPASTPIVGSVHASTDEARGGDAGGGELHGVHTPYGEQRRGSAPPTAVTIPTSLAEVGGEQVNVSGPRDGAEAATTASTSAAPMREPQTAFGAGVESAGGVDGDGDRDSRAIGDAFVAGSTQATADAPTAWQYQV